ncbi:hypothetical protein NUW58_g3455 [Xylaria curta]|uniref:Uncharacterized protein n=1 Tax=Xylaria curta TaxID=42375 RepID=A0ACC1PBV2_9PEZI|nr:hypothetical protein NUW58_g3455 [Xylaria curta]
MPGPQPIAQIFCRYIEKQLPSHFQPGKGFIDAQARRETRSVVGSCASLDVSLLPGQTVKIGRDIQHNDIAIRHLYVSRQHFVFYSIEYEEGVRPLVYVRDYRSLGGTYVDNHSGRRAKVSPPAYLLSHNDIIRIDPYWEFHVYLLGAQPMGSVMSPLRSSETDLFRNRFLITEQILGKGALARVHLAVNLRTGQQVACKIHQLGSQLLKGSPDMVRRILDESNILSRTTHPNILKFEAAFRSSDTLYTFTELAAGGDLFSLRLKYPDGLPEMDTKIIIRQILDAIIYLHEQNVAHRDLKPENVFLVTGPTHMTRVVVGDLGFARVASEGRMASLVGTRRFTAPEVLYRESYGTEVDIWSIGMISLFLAVIDWNGSGHFQVLDQHSVDEGLTNVFDDLSKRYKALSDYFEGFIRRCLVVEPAHRMTAAVSKDHSWFNSSKSQLEIQIKEFTKGWKPARIVHNSVEDLDLFEDTKTWELSSTISLSKRTLEDVGKVEMSRHFAKGGVLKHKRQKTEERHPSPS